MNKKASIFGYMYLILLFVFVATFGMFYSIFLYDVGGEQIITPFTNQSLALANSTNLSSAMNTAIAGFETSYYNDEPAWDLYFILTFVGFFVVSIGSSFLARKENGFGFFGIVTIGMLVFLLALGLIDQIGDWLIFNLFTGLLNFNLTSTPFMNAYFQNIELWSFTWAVLIVLVNQIDLDIFSRERGSVQP